MLVDERLGGVRTWLVNGDGDVGWREEEDRAGKYVRDQGANVWLFKSGGRERYCLSVISNILVAIWTVVPSTYLYTVIPCRLRKNSC